jgi:TatD DNase family protein
VTLYFFDTHAHIQRSRSERGDDLAQLLENGRNNGVRAILAPSVNRADWDLLPEIATIRGVSLYFSLGLHPYYVMEVTSAQTSDLVEELGFRVISAHPRMRAIGECGLDFARARDADDRAHQLAVFRAHLELARATGLPLSIHCVKAHAPMLELLREKPTPPSVMHAFSGSAELARVCAQAGHYVSFAGNLLLANARKVVEAARAVPEDRVLIETDTPDQTPPARRPAPNEPAFIVDVAQGLARVRGRSLEAIAATTMLNARRVFGLLDAPELDEP